jgi:DNA-binding transcriptional LysR family regulator
MELRQLEYFVAVAEEANFTRAAERVHISQSGVSAQIRQLESDLGATLIDRSGRSATLTPAGTAALEHARAALASVAAVRDAVDEVTGPIPGLFESLASFHRTHPGVDIRLLEDSSDPLTDRVRTGRADVALIGTAGAPPGGLEAWPISNERLVAAVPFDHLLARRKTATLASLATYPIVCMPEGTAPRTMFDRTCAEHDLQMDIVLQASAPDAVAALALRGLGVAILTESMVANHGRLKALTIRDIRTAAGLALVWRATQSPALRAFLLHSYVAFVGPRVANGS